jgi:hypothetical protein
LDHTHEKEAMPKVAKHVLTWLPERSVYELRGPNGVNEQPIQGEDEKWFTRLSTLSSFAFRGQHGNLTLRKENRTSGEGTGMPIAVSTSRLSSAMPVELLT